MTENERVNKGVDNDFYDYRDGVLKFATAAVCIFAAFMAVYEYYLIDADIFIDYLEVSATSATWFLNNFTPENVELTIAREDIKTRIQSLDHKTAFVVVTTGCDASIVFATLISTVLAWPSPLLKRVAAVSVGLAIMYCLNILRISGMLLVDVHLPNDFDLFHEWILPGLLIVGPLIYFYVWTIISGTHPGDN